MIFEALTVVLMKIQVFCDVTLSQLVCIYQCFLLALFSSKTLASTYWTT